MKIQLTAGLCGSRLYETRCGDWLSNGHWLARGSLFKRVKATPDLDASKPEAGTILGQISERYRRVEVSDVRLNGAVALFATDKPEIVTWSGEHYADVLLSLGEAVWASELDPIFVTAGGGLIERDVLVALMPMRAPDLLDRSREALRRWLG